MNDQEVLQKAIQMAIDGGWDWDQLPAEVYNGLSPDEKLQAVSILIPSNMYYSVIFNHDFAQELWGSDYLGHLQQMVILDEPLKYIAFHIQ